MKPGDKRATKAVLRNLTKETGIHEEVWEHFLVVGTPIDDFMFSAKAWLSDKSELKTDTIECADWQEIYDYFQEQLKPDTPTPEPAMAQEAPQKTPEDLSGTPCAGALRFVDIDGAKYVMCLSHANEHGATILDYRSNQYTCIIEWGRRNA